MKKNLLLLILTMSFGMNAQVWNSNGTSMQMNGNTALGDYSVALGKSTTANGNYSTTTGLFTTAAYTSFASGHHSDALGNTSTAMGYYTLASGSYSTAMGKDTEASGAYSTAIGNNSTAIGNNSTAMGSGSTAIGNNSTAIGTATEALGTSSFAAGIGTIANDINSMAIGMYNQDDSLNPNNFYPSNTAFVIGNGINPDDRSNAFEVLFDGTTTIAGDLSINSDARLKANIISLGATLSKLLQIDGKTYTMKKDANHKKKIGLLAQDIEKVFPELVTETNDIKSVNYQGLVPVLINAMKEQQDEIERLKKQDAINQKQQQEIDELKAMVKQFISK